MEEETMKRCKYTESRRKNASKKESICTAYEKHMHNHMENENENINIDIKEGVKGEKKKFAPPTLEEVKAYCKSRNNTVDPKTFFDYFTAGEWKDAKGNKVRNWKQKVITWEGRQPKQEAPPKPRKSHIEIGEDGQEYTVWED